MVRKQTADRERRPRRPKEDETRRNLKGDQHELEAGCRADRRRGGRLPKVTRSRRVQQKKRDLASRCKQISRFIVESECRDIWPGIHRDTRDSALWLQHKSSRYLRTQIIGGKWSWSSSESTRGKAAARTGTVNLRLRWPGRLSKQFCPSLRRYFSAPAKTSASAYLYTRSNEWTRIGNPLSHGA